MPTWLARLITLCIAALVPFSIYALWTDRSWIGVTSNTTQAAAQLAWAASALGLEAVVLGWSASSLRSFLTERSSRSDLVSFLTVHSGLWNLLGTLFGVGIAWHAGTVLGTTFNLDIIKLIPSTYLQIAAGIAAASFVTYLVHYCEHHVPFMWELHKYHHSADEMSVATAYRYVPVNFAVIVGLIPARMLGSSAESLLIFALWQQFHIFLVHSRLRWHFGWFGRWIYVSPNYHRLHHSADPQHHNANFSVDLVLWDRLFGTYRDPRIQVEQIGIPGEPQEGYFKDAVRSVTASYRIMVAELARLLPQDWRNRRRTPERAEREGPWPDLPSAGSPEGNPLL